MKKLITITLVLFGYISKCQDTSQVIHHEIGFNTVMLLKQLISNNPSSVLSQSPYLIFYNGYFDKTVGIRLGVGGNMSKSTVNVAGQIDPRVTNSFNYNVRTGVTFNYVTSNRLTLNSFVDLIYTDQKVKTVNTSTVQSFPNPVFSQRVESTSRLNGLGFQFGTGVKYNMYKNLSLYIEVPVSIISSKLKEEDVIYTNGTLDKLDISKSENTQFNITLPTTLYLVLRF